MKFTFYKYKQAHSSIGFYSFFYLFWLLLYNPSLSEIMPCNANFQVSSINCNVASFTPEDNTPGLTYLWDFGDGTISNEARPDHVFATAIGNGKQSFQVTLTVSGPDCDQTTSSPMSVEVDQVPDISLEDTDMDLLGNSLNFVHCANGTLKIRDNSSTKATNRSYEIDWGDGSASFNGSTIPDNTSHTYVLPGRYNISVTVTGNNNCTATKVVPFFFGSNPSVGFGIAALAAQCSPYEVEFPISGVENNVPGTTYEITVNDGSEPQIFNHPPPASYTHTFRESSCGTISSTAVRDFNDAFQVTIVATNPCGEAAAEVVPVRINLPPTADFTIAPDPPQCVGTIFDFDNTSDPGLFYDAQTDQCFSFVNARWSIEPNNGYTITSGSLTDTAGFSARFDQPGIYEITLEINHLQQNPVCASDRITKEICVIPNPESSFVPDETFGCIGLVVDFDNTSNTLNSCDTTYYEWLVGLAEDQSECTPLTGGDISYLDDTDENSLEPKIRFNTSGVYVVGLAISNFCGNDTSYQTITIADDPLIEIAEIEDFCDQGSNVIRPVLSINTGCNAADDPVYNWTFEGGNPRNATGLDPGDITYDGPGTYTIRLTARNSCGPTETTQTFTILPLPEIPDYNSNSPVCTNTELRITTTDDTEGLAFTWATPSQDTLRTQNVIVPQAGPDDAGTYFLTVTDINTGCEQSTSFEVEVFDLPPIQITPEDPEVCIDETLTLRATGSSNFSWRPADNLNRTDGDVVVFTPPAVGTYEIIVEGSDGQNCMGMDTVTIVVNDLPVVSVLANQTACVGINTQLMASPENGMGGSGTWSGNFVSPDGTFNPTQAGEYQVTYTFTDENSCQNSAMGTVCAISDPVASFTLDQTEVCTNPIQRITATNTSNVITDCSAATYTWTLNFLGSDCSNVMDGFRFINGNTNQNAELEITSPGRYELILEVSNDCNTVSSRQEITVGRTPELTIDSIPTSCFASPSEIDFSATVMSCESVVNSYAWEFPDAEPSTSSEENPTNIRYNMPGTYTARLTINSNCGSTSTERTFRILEGPSLDIELDTTFGCITESINVINNSRGDDLTYSWTVSDPAAIGISDANSRNPVFTLNGPIGDYTIEVVLGNPVCDGITKSFNVRISDDPTVSLMAIDNFCEVASFSPMATFSDQSFIDSVRWRFPAEANIQTSTDFDPGTININTPGNYQVEVTVYNACGNQTSMQSFQVFEGPDLNIQLDTAFVCIGGSFGVQNTSTGDALQYSWTVDDPAAFNISGSDTPSPTFTAVGPIGDYTISVSVGNPECDAIRQEFPIRISDEPTVSLAAIDNFCEVASFSPMATFSDQSFIDSVRWRFPAEADVQTSTDFDPGTININTPGNYQVEVTVYNACGSQTSMQSFQVFEGPDLNIQLDTAFVCVGGSFGVQNTSTGDSLQYTWTVDDPAAFNISGSDTPSPTFTAVGPIGDYTISVSVGNPECDAITQEFQVRISDEPTVSLAAIDNFCEVASFSPMATFSDQSFIDSVRWRFPAEADVQTSTDFDPGTININTPGSYQVEVTVYNACGSQTSMQSFQVFDGPDLNIQLDTAFVCIGGSFGVQNTSTGDSLQYNWTVDNPSAFNIGGSDTPTPTFTAVGPIGDYTISVSVGNPECDAITQEFQVRISDEPMVSLAAIDNFCEVASFSPIATYSDRSFIDSVRWRFPVEANIMTSTDFDPGVIEINVPGVYQVEVTVYNACGSQTSMQSFQVFDGPDLNIQLDTAFVCIDGSFGVQNTSTGDSLQYSWTVDDPTAFNISGSDTPSPTFTAVGPIGDYTISVSVGNPECDPVTQELLIQLSEVPEVTLDPIGSFCGEALFTPSLNYQDTSIIDSVRWEFPGATQTTSTDFFPTGISYPMPGDYSITVTAFNRCGSSTSVQNFKVFEPIEVSAQLSDSLGCVIPGMPFTIDAINSSDGDSLNYTWSVSGPFPQSVEFDATVRSPSFIFRDTGQYIVQLSVFNDICGEVTWQDTVDIVLLPQPSLTPAPDVCENAMLSPVVDYGSYRLDSVVWDFTGGQPASSRARFPQNIEYSAGGTYIYTLTAYNECGFTVLKDTFEIDTIPEIILGPSDTLCIDQGVFQLAPPIPPGGIWQGSPAIIDATQGLFDPLIAGGGTTTIEYVFMNGECTIVTPKDIYVIDLRNDVNGGADINVCVSEDSIQLSGAVPSGGWYQGEGVADSSGLFLPSSIGVGAYTVTYTYQFPGTDCIFSDELVVNVRPLPIAEIGNLDSLCVNTPVTFPNASSGGENFIWRVNGEALYTETEPVHIFVDTGFVRIGLLAISPFGCLDSMEVEVYISGPPIAQFAMDTTEGCAVLPITFDNESIPFEYFRYEWDFGDGTTSTLDEPGTRRFAQGLEDTTYYINLVATNHCGIDIAVDSVTVFPKPIPIPILSNDFGCTPLEIEFNNTSRGLPDAYFWDLGNGVTTTDSLPLPQIYEALDTFNAIYPVTLTASNECGDSSVTREILVKPQFIRAFFSANINEGCEPLEVSFFNTTNPDSAIVYNWDFGDGNTSQAEDTTYTFMAQGDSITTYTITLLADNGCARDEISLDIKVFPAPVVDFEVTPVACANDTTRFFNRSIDVSANFWEFGDGDTSLAANPIHVYQMPGVYTVRLTSFSASTGCPNTTERSIEVREIPSVDFEVENLFGCPPHRIDLSNRTPNASFFEWQFGDGNSRVGREVPGGYLYEEPGFYSVTLIATDEFGCKNDSTFDFVQVYPVPEINFSIDYTPECGLPQIVCMDNQTEGAAGFEWNFGNGQTSEETQACVEYPDAGQYDITLVARNEFLCEASQSQVFTAYDVPVALFDTTRMESCEGSVLSLINRSSNVEAEFTRWYVNDQLVLPSSNNLFFTFPDTGYYDVKLVVGNGSGCKDSLEVKQLARVFSTPIADFTYNKLEEERPTTIQFFDNSSSDVVAWSWDFDDGTGSNEPNPRKRFLSRFNKNVQLIVSSVDGCTDTTNQLIQLDTISGLFIPNTIEPNHPDKGKSEFLPQGIGLSNYHIAIYTRQGQLVWESTSLDEEGSPDEAWKGDFNGAPLSNGVYVWQILQARFIDGDAWDGMADEQGRLRKSGFVRVLR